MALNRLQTRRSYTPLTRLTLIALVINTLAYASEFVMIGHIDFEIAIVVGCLMVACILVAMNWRWAPAIGALLAGGILLGNPFLLYNLSQPFTNGFFLAATTQVFSGLVVVGAGVGAALQNYRKRS